MTFSASDLLLSDPELATLTAALASAAQPDPVGLVIAENLARVQTVTDPYDLPEPWLRALVRALVLFHLYSRLGQAVPAHVKSAYDEAAKDLGEIREGRYASFLREGARPAALSAPLVLPRSARRETLP